MANIRKAKLLQKELNALDRQKLDYIEKLANSLLAIQNTMIDKKDVSKTTPSPGSDPPPDYEEDKG